MSINYLHFDTAQREDLSTDSFSCELKLSNPLRNVKKIYLKSVEIPVGFFNIRETQYFEYVSSHIYYSNFNQRTVSLLGVFAYKPTYENNYVTEEFNSNFFTYTKPIKATPSSSLTPQQQNAYKVSVAIPPGNYTITTLLNYINDKLGLIFTLHEPTFKGIVGFPYKPTFELTSINASDTSIFPVGYIRATFNSTNIWIVPTDFSSKYLGFNKYAGALPRFQESNDQTYIDAIRPWNLHQDLCLYLYFENIPQTNTHFKNNLASFKIPIKSGYQCIEYNAENITFAQYIENTDVNYIFDKIKLKVYDRFNNLINNNGFDFKFTLGIET
jgi:hypothetical protein